MKLASMISGAALVCLGMNACVTSGQILGLSETESAELPSMGGAPSSGGSSSSMGGEATETGGTSSGGTTAGGAPMMQPGPLGTELQVAAGDVHSCGVVDGGLYCWGDNGSGALGLGDFDARWSPARIGGESDWAQVGVGDRVSCARRSGRVWCFGNGSNGELGAGAFSDSNTPVEVSLPSAAVLLGVDHSTACVILDDDSLHCWGANAEGQLGQGDPWAGPGVDSAVPLEVDAGSRWVTVDPGQGHTCGIQTDGTLWCWGRNSRGELGQGGMQADQTRLPEQVGTDSDWTAVECGQNHTCGIRDGQLYCWGDNSHNQLSEAVGDSFVEEPLLIGLPNPVQVTVDTFHTCVIDTSGDSHCWGRNIEGQLGDGTIERKLVPTLALPSGSWEQIDAGRFHTCGVREGTILCTGDNGSGRLGTSDLERRREFSPTISQ